MIRQLQRLRTVKLLWAGLAAAAIALFFVWRYSASPDRQARAQTVEFIGAVAAQDWLRVYRQAPQAEYATIGITAEQFAKLMSSIAQDLPAKAFQDITLEPVPSSGERINDGFRMFLITFPNAKTRGKTAQQVTHAMRDKEGWHVAVNELPLRVNDFHDGSAKERLARFAAALEEANIDSYPLSVDGPTMTPGRIREFIQGNITLKEMYRPPRR